MEEIIYNFRDSAAAASALRSPSRSATMSGSAETRPCSPASRSAAAPSSPPEPSSRATFRQTPSPPVFLPASCGRWREKNERNICTGETPEHARREGVSMNQYCVNPLSKNDAAAAG